MIASVFIRMQNPLIIVKRIIVRICMILFLFGISTPGVVFWIPVFLNTKRTEWKIVEKGKVQLLFPGPRCLIII